MNPRLIIVGVASFGLALPPGASAQRQRPNARPRSNRPSLCEVGTIHKTLDDWLVV